LNHSQIVSFIWGVADLIRDTFKRGKYQDVILPLTVLRRLDCVLAPTKGKVLETGGKFKGKLKNLDPQLRRASGFAFYNTSRYDFEKLLADAPHLAANLRNYIKGFSPYFEREVRPYVPDAWINTSIRDEKDGQIGRVGCEINFNRYFYKYTPPRPLEEIEADIKSGRPCLFGPGFRR